MSFLSPQSINQSIIFYSLATGQPTLTRDTIYGYLALVSLRINTAIWYECLALVILRQLLQYLQDYTMLHVSKV